MKTIVSLQNNLISLADKVFPGVNELFTSPDKDDGHQKWVDFFYTFWHADCIANVSEKFFTDRYQKWCKRKGYRFSQEKAENLYIESAGLILTLPKNECTKMLVQTAAQQMIDTKVTLAAFRDEMIRLAAILPEYETVLSMYGVGEITAAQLMTEIGDVSRFPFCCFYCNISFVATYNFASYPTLNFSYPEILHKYFAHQIFFTQLFLEDVYVL